MSNKTFISDGVAWLEWLEANMLDRDKTPKPDRFPCVAVLLENRTAYVYLTDFLPF